MRLNVILDVDGTLEGYGGPVSEKLCMDLQALGARCWMLSKRPTEKEVREICSKFDLTPIPMEGKDYFHMKHDAIRLLKMDFPGEHFVYVGDKLDDACIAWEAKVAFCLPKMLTTKIFEEICTDNLLLILGRMFKTGSGSNDTCFDCDCVIHCEAQHKLQQLIKDVHESILIWELIAKYCWKYSKRVNR